MPELPDRPNLDQLRHQARELLRAARVGDQLAMDRVRAVSDELALSAAQLAIAREYGYASWSTLKDDVARRQSTRPGDMSAWAARGPGAIMTDPARRIIGLAQEEARLLTHEFVGTEHLLLGLANDTDGVPAQLLAERGVVLDALRQQVREIIGPSQQEAGGAVPFTPRAKRALELSLHEALDLGVQEIAPEHILLGLIAEGSGVAILMLARSGIDLDDLRRAVEERTGVTRRRPGTHVVGGVPFPLTSESIRGTATPVPRAARLVACSFCGRRPPASGRLVQARDASICEYCISEWGERMATVDDQEDIERSHGSEEAPG